MWWWPGAGLHGLPAAWAEECADTLLAATAAVLNVVPYIGPWVGSLLPMFIALITKRLDVVSVGALGVMTYPDSSTTTFITPKIVGSWVDVNPLASMVALLAGGMLWGVAGLSDWPFRSPVCSRPCVTRYRTETVGLPAR